MHFYLRIINKKRIPETKLRENHTKKKNEWELFVLLPNQHDAF